MSGIEIQYVVNSDSQSLCKICKKIHETLPNYNLYPSTVIFFFISKKCRENKGIRANWTKKMEMEVPLVLRKILWYLTKRSWKKIWSSSTDTGRKIWSEKLNRSYRSILTSVEEDGWVKRILGIAHTGIWLKPKNTIMCNEYKNMSSP